MLLIPVFLLDFENGKESNSFALNYIILML